MRVCVVGITGHVGRFMISMFVEFVAEVIVVGSGKTPLSQDKTWSKAGLIGGHGKLAIDSGDIFLVCDDKAGQIFGKMFAFWLVGKQRAKRFKGIINDGWKSDDSGHNHVLHDFVTCPAINMYRRIAHLESKKSFCKSLVI